MTKLLIASIVVATVLLMTPAMADGGLGLRLKAEIEQRLMEPDAHRGSLCFETGDGSSKFYQAAKCVRDDTGSFGPYRCTFDNGDPETECFTHDNGCFVCSGMD